MLKEWTPDLVITDLRMPNLGGLELCRQIRAKSRIPIIVLSVKGEERIKVEALDAGADDYVTKPFGVHELLARVRATLRRAAAPEQPESPLIEAGDFRIDIATRSVRVQDREVHLTPKEFDLLIVLARHAGKVLTHRDLLAAIWGAKQCGAAGIPARFRRPLAEKTRARRGDSSLYPHRALGGISI